MPLDEKVDYLLDLPLYGAVRTCLKANCRKFRSEPFRDFGGMRAGYRDDRAGRMVHRPARRGDGGDDHSRGCGLVADRVDEYEASRRAVALVGVEREGRRRLHDHLRDGVQSELRRR